MPRLPITTKLVCAAALLSCSLSANAGTGTHAYDYQFSNDLFPELFRIGNDGNHVAGWEFQVHDMIEVTRVSVWDESSVDHWQTGGHPGLVDNAPIAIFNSAGQIVTSVTIPAGEAAAFDSATAHRYVELASPVILNPGERYTIARLVYGGVIWDEENPVDAWPSMESLFQQSGDDPDAFERLPFETHDAISYVSGRWDFFTGDTLGFPDEEVYFGDPDFGREGYNAGAVNFSFNTVPAPATLTLIPLLMACNKRRR